MINWKQKLTSRKFWIGCLLMIVGSVLCAIGDTENGLAMITYGGISYIGCEMLVDIFRIVFSSEFLNKGNSDAD